MGSLKEQFREQEALRAEKQRQGILTVLTVTNLAIAAGVVVVVLILALVVPMLIPRSAEQRYLDEREHIRLKLLVYTTGYAPKWTTGMPLSSVTARMAEASLGLYPTFAQTNLGSASALKEENVGNEEITTLGAEFTNPMGAKEFSVTPSWEDVDGDGKRNPANDKLFYHNASPEPAVDHWITTTVTVKGTDYVVDSRDYFISFDLMLRRGFIDSIPESASPDNSVDGAGSYSWYVDEDLKVRSMLYTRPVPEEDGYQEVYP